MGAIGFLFIKIKSLLFGVNYTEAVCLCSGSSQKKLYFVRTITIDGYLTLYKGAGRGNLLAKHTIFLF